jgi:hypothetical protein
MSAREEHYSGKLMGEIKKGKSMIILTIRTGREDQLKKTLLGLGQSLILRKPHYARRYSQPLRVQES